MYSGDGYWWPGSLRHRTLVVCCTDVNTMVVSVTYPNGCMIMTMYNHIYVYIYIYELIDSMYVSSWSPCGMEYFKHYGSFVRGIHLSVVCPHNGPIMLKFDVFLDDSLESCWTSSRVAGDLRCQEAHMTSVLCKWHTNTHTHRYIYIYI